MMSEKNHIWNEKEETFNERNSFIAIIQFTSLNYACENAIRQIKTTEEKIDANVYFTLHC